MNTIQSANGARTFACFPAAVLVYLVNAQGQFLLLAHPKRDGWEIVSGAMEADETVLEGALRELHEEAGAGVQARPLGAFHVTSFHYDEKVRYMLSLHYLLAYEGGEIQTGDDMAGSQYRWWSVAELLKEETSVLVPVESKWLFERALEAYHAWSASNELVKHGTGVGVRTRRV